LRISRAFRFLTHIAASLVIGVAMPAFAGTSPAIKLMGNASLATVVERVVPAVVSVVVKLKAPADATGNAVGSRQDPYMASGSGVIVDAMNGYVMTNFEVIRDAASMAVILHDGREFTAKLVGGDEGTDIALLQIDAKDLVAIPVGDSDALRAGDFVLAVGNPFGLTQTVTAGIVSALNRSGFDTNRYQDLIQTSLSISPGSSGGALVNLKGELVGINTIIAPDGGGLRIGFAVPMAMASSVMKQLVSFGEVKRGHIGMEAENMTPTLAKALGVEQALGAVVEDVDKNSSADRSGVRTGDVVIALDGKPLASAADLHNRLGVMIVGTKLHLTVLRDGAPKDLIVTIDGASETTAVASIDTRQTLRGALFAGKETEESKTGVEVTDVAHDSPAWRIGLRPNDFVVAVNRKPISSLSDFEAALNASPSHVTLSIVRGSADLLIIG